MTARRDIVPRFIRGVAGTLETYPEVLGVPSSATARVGTPATALPATGSAATVDSLIASLTAAAAQGDTEIACSGVAVVNDQSDVTSTDTTVLLDTYALDDGVYAVSIAYVIATENGGLRQGTITATVTFDGGVNTAVADTLDTPTTSTGDAASMAIAITGPGFSITGTGSSPTSVEWITAVTYTRTPNFQRGVRYLIGGTADDTVLSVEHVGADDSASLVLAEPLPVAVDSGTKVYGIRITASLSASDTGTLGEGVSEWKAQIGGVVHKWTTHFRIVERDAQYTLTPTTLTSSSPYCAKNRPDSDTDYTETIDAAWRRYVYPKLLAKALRPERIVGGEHFEAVHIAACEFYLAVEFDDDAEKRAERKALLADAMETVLLASDLWISPVAEDLSNTTDVDTPGVGAGAAYSVTYISR